MAESTSDGDDLFESVKEDEYSTQFFGFSPQSFINGIYNIYCENLVQACKALGQSIISTFKGRVSEAEVKEASKQQLQAAVKRLDTLFDSTESYMKRNIFSIPPSVVLPEDRAHLEVPGGLEDQRTLESNITLLENKILAVKLANTKLERRISTLDKLRADYTHVLSDIKDKQQRILLSGAFETEKTFREATEDLQKALDHNSQMEAENDCL